MIQNNHEFDPYHLQGQYAGFVTRLVALLLDIVIISTIYGLTVSVTQLIGGFFNLDFYELMTTNWLIGLTVAVLALLFPILYFVFFWALSGQTPGKAIIGIRVCGLDGGRIGVVRALLRYGGYWLSTGAFLFGFLWVLVDNRRQALHDKLARTVVIYSWEARIHELVVERAQQRSLQRRRRWRR